MPTLDLAALRGTAPTITPEQFLRYHPGCFLQYFDDTPSKDPAKALSADRFDPAVAARKQADGCAVCYSLQAFQGSRTKEGLLVHRHLGVDVDQGKGGDLDRAKRHYLTAVLSRFPLGPHWLTETAHGFHLVFRVLPSRTADAVAHAEALNRRLVVALGGDPNAASLTQVFRVPGTVQFKDPAHPYRCRLLLDLSGAVPPYPPARVEAALAEWAGTTRVQVTVPPARVHSVWRAGLAGVPEGRRNAVAASLAGRLASILPPELWATAAWGGLKEWNARNPDPLAERELRGVYASVTRREWAARRPVPPPPACSPSTTSAAR